MHDIIIYSLPHCEFCKLTAEFFSSKNEPFTKIDVSRNSAAQRELLEKSGQFNVPVVEIDGNVIIGYQKALFERFLEQ